MTSLWPIDQLVNLVNAICRSVSALHQDTISLSFNFLGLERIIRKLVERTHLVDSAYLNATDKNGNSALILAAWKGFSFSSF